MKYRSKNGFTLAELLIVVAIIAVLVAVSIPIFNGQLEKARRAVDMQNARIIKSALTNAYNEGRMDIPKKAVGQENSGCGVWVVICRSTSELPDAYTSDMLNGKSIYCDGASRHEKNPYFLVKELKTGILENITGVYCTPKGYMADERDVEIFDITFPGKGKIEASGTEFLDLYEFLKGR